MGLDVCMYVCMYVLVCMGKQLGYKHHGRVTTASQSQRQRLGRFGFGFEKRSFGDEVGRRRPRARFATTTKARDDDAGDDDDDVEGTRGDRGRDVRPGRDLERDVVRW